MTWAEVRRRLNDRMWHTLLYIKWSKGSLRSLGKWLDILNELQRLNIKPPNVWLNRGSSLLVLQWRRPCSAQIAWTIVIDWDGRVSIHQGEVTPTPLYDTRHTSMARPTAR